MLPKLILLASGTGSHVQAIINFLTTNPIAEVALIVTNNPQAGVLNIARAYNIPSLLITKQQWQQDIDTLIATLQSHSPALLVLAGFLWKLPTAILQAFPNKIINIHPSLLPRYGGKGMYGIHVHEAVLAAGDAHSGVTIHYVNEEYDKGAILLQATCPVPPSATAQALAQAVLRLEHYYYPRVIAYLIGG